MLFLSSTVPVIGSEDDYKKLGFLGAGRGTTYFDNEQIKAIGVLHSSEVLTAVLIRQTRPGTHRRESSL